MTEDRIANSFLRRFAHDRARGAAQSLEHYQRLFPGHDALIAAHYARCHSGSSAGSERIGDFEILSEMGRGGQGVVYLAEDTRLGRKVALKSLSGLRAVTPEAFERLLREARIASRLAHPGICAVHEAGIAEGAPYIAMQYVEGSTLAEHIAEAKTSEPARLDRTRVLEIVELVEKAARALHAAHEAGVLHRDVKPGNIMVTPTREAVLLDFGLASEPDSDITTLTRSAEWFGTPAYMSPEQLARNAVVLDRRTDVWSLGVCLFEALTLQRPFEAPTREALFQAIVHESPFRARRLNPAIPKDLAVVLDTALEKDRNHRYLTAEAFAADLRAVLAGRPIAAKPIGALGRMVRWAQREPVIASLLAIVALAVPAISVLIALRIQDAPRLEMQQRMDDERLRDEYLAEGHILLEAFELEQAVARFETALDLDPRSVEAVLGIAVVQINGERCEAALTTLDAHRTLLEGRRSAIAQRNRVLRLLARADERQDSLPPPRDALDYFIEGNALMVRSKSAPQADREQALAQAQNAYMAAVVLSKSPRLPFYAAAANAAARRGDRSTFHSLESAILEFWRDSAAAHFSLGWALYSAGQFDRAVAAHRESVRLSPDNALFEHDLACALHAQGSFDESIHWFQSAIRLRSTAQAHSNLGLALESKGLLEQAIREYQLSVQQEATRVDAHYKLAAALCRSGRFDEAELAGRNAIALKPDDANLRGEISDDRGIALTAHGRFDEAIAEHKKALELRVSPFSFNYLAAALYKKREFRLAIEAAQNAIHLKGDLPEAYCNLGLALKDDGRFEEALKALRRGDEIGSSREGWTYGSKQWVSECEMLVGMERRMLEAASPNAPPVGGDDLIQFASLATLTRRWALAVDWYVAAFERNSALANSNRGLRTLAARAAVQAAGQGAEPGSTSMANPQRLRALALAWLQQELAAEREQLAPEDVRESAARLLADALLAPVRGEEASRLDPAESGPWLAFWAEVAEAAK